MICVSAALRASTYLAGAALDHHMAVLAQGRALLGVSERGTGVGGLEVNVKALVVRLTVSVPVFLYAPCRNSGVRIVSRGPRCFSRAKKKKRLLQFCPPPRGRPNRAGAAATRPGKKPPLATSSSSSRNVTCTPTRRPVTCTLRAPRPKQHPILRVPFGIENGACYGSRTNGAERRAACIRGPANILRCRRGCGCRWQRPGGRRDGREQRAERGHREGCRHDTRRPEPGAARQHRCCCGTCLFSSLSARRAPRTRSTRARKSLTRPTRSRTCPTASARRRRPSPRSPRRSSARTRR